MKFAVSEDPDEGDADRREGSPPRTRRDARGVTRDFRAWQITSPHIVTGRGSADRCGEWRM